MNGNNLTFLSDPIWYIRNRAINNIKWFKQVHRSAGLDRAAASNRVTALNVLKEGYFDLQGSAQDREVLLALVGDVGTGDRPISAYWCPFIQGNVLPGYVDIPRVNPVHHFVFTAAMNGCALVATHSPLGANMIRIYHNQHPDSAAINNLIAKQGQSMISIVKFDDYGVDFAPNAFNFLYYRNGGWRYVLQPQILNMLTDDVGINNGIPQQVLDVV